MRKFIKKKYGIPCFNYPDVKLGEELLFKLYCTNTGLSPFVVKKLGTPRESIKLSECIFSYIEFKTKPFQALKNWMFSQTITSTKGAFSDLPLSKVTELLPYVDKSLISGKTEKTLDNINIMVQGNPVIYGTGGLHHSCSGKYVSDNQWIILDIDVGFA